MCVRVCAGVSAWSVHVGRNLLICVSVCVCECLLARLSETKGQKDDKNSDSWHIITPAANSVTSDTHTHTHMYMYTAHTQCSVDWQPMSGNTGPTVSCHFNDSLG